MNATHHYGQNQHHGFVDSHSQHMSHGPPSSAPPPYPQYPVSAPLLPPTIPSSYAPTHGYYGYATPTTPHAPQYTHPHHQLGMSSANSAPANNAGASLHYDSSARLADTTGQVLPPGMKPKITATLWEDEGTLCFQVEVNGICVARRSDNAFINGTKLLNVAKMTRGRRDGILKSEKNRNVIKIGPMHLKGVWIPYDRALEFANKEKITEQLYPLFVHEVQNHLGQAGIPQNASSISRRTGSGDMYPRAMAAQTPTDRHQAHSPQSVAPNHSGHASRPSLDRAHTFPTPPNTASTVGMSSSGSSYEWSGHGLAAHQPVPLDNAAGTKSMPTTPASTPPESLHHSQYITSQTQPAYDSSRPVYAAAPLSHSSPYAMAPIAHYGYGKTEMAPPLRIPHGESVSPKEDGVEIHNGHYNAERGYNNYSTSMDNVQSSPVGDGYKPSPTSGRVAPRTLEYTTPQRGSNGYAAASPQTPQSYYHSGQVQSQKRRREVEEDPYSRPSSQNGETELKRRRTVREDSAGPQRPIANPSLSRARSTLQWH